MEKEISSGTYQQNEDGSYSAAVPIGMTCEHGKCKNQQGKDYKRKEEDPEWQDEPIFLCDQHSKGFEPL